MLTIQQIKTRLLMANKYRVAIAAGLNPGQVYNITRDKCKPSHATVLALSNYFERVERGGN